MRGRDRGWCAPTVEEEAVQRKTWNRSGRGHVRGLRKKPTNKHNNLSKSFTGVQAGALLGGVPANYLWGVTSSGGITWRCEWQREQHIHPGQILEIVTHRFSRLKFCS